VSTTSVARDRFTSRPGAESDRHALVGTAAAGDL
jgi:hypothetical protein